MLPPSVHAFAALKRACQSRKTGDKKLRLLLNRAITLREIGEHRDAMVVEKQIAAHVERQITVGGTIDQAVQALHKTLREEQAKRNSKVTVTITVGGGTPRQDAKLASQVTRTIQKAVNPTSVKVERTLNGEVHIPSRSGPLARRAITVVSGAAMLLVSLSIPVVGERVTSLAAGFRCVKTPVPAGLVLPYCPKRHAH
jgi:hypothetical protein